MIDLHRILVPTDFSKHSANALTYAVAFAEKFSAELHLLHVDGREARARLRASLVLLPGHVGSFRRLSGIRDRIATEPPPGTRGEIACAPPVRARSFARMRPVRCSR